MIAVQIFYGTIYLFILVTFISQGLKSIALNSSSKSYSRLRKLYWTTARMKLIEGTINNWKVQSYLIKYLNSSLAIKDYYIRNGFAETRYLLIGKVEELQRFVEEYKYNSFDNLDMFENEFINRFQIKKHKS